MQIDQILNMNNKENLIKILLDLNNYIQGIEFDLNNKNYIKELRKENNKKLIQSKIDLLYNESIYKEKIVEYAKENVMRYPSRREKIFHFVKNLNINNKEEFMIIFSRFSCLDFFILNYDKFNYTKNEKEFLVHAAMSCKYKDVDLKEIKKIREKTNIISPFLKIDIDNNFNKEKFDYFTDNFKYVEKFRKREILLSIFFPKGLNKRDNLKENLYIDFFKRNKDYIAVFEMDLKREINRIKRLNKTKNIQEIISVLEEMIGYTEKMLLKEEIRNELKNF